MFRASDIFGRRPGNQPSRPSVKQEDKRAATGPTTKTWDPATGQFIEEELPADLQELMGISAPKRVKSELPSNGQAWAQGGGGAMLPQQPPRALGPAAVGLAPSNAMNKPRALLGAGPPNRNVPSVEYQGFRKVDLNDRYYERADMIVHGRPTFWSSDGQFFAYWQGEVDRWSICDASSLIAVQSGQYPGWAYKGDHRHLANATGWMEAWNGEWSEPELEVIFRMSSEHPPQWIDPELNRAITTVEFKGFAMTELNTRYFLRQSEIIQGKPSYWDSSGVYFIYWQAPSNRWAICDLKCLQAVKEGQCPGWAYKSEQGHFANACGWVERRMDAWLTAHLETSVISTSARGLKVEMKGFSKDDLNTTYQEKHEEEIQGKPSYWDPSGNYFIYWQSSMQRWAICDNVSLDAAKSGLSPGWAYRTDPHHFTRANTWMEVWGRDWKKTSILCRVLEGMVKEPVSAVKSEIKEEGAFAKAISIEQYKVLVERIYQDKNPAKLNDLPTLMLKYAGREHEFYQQVCEKYGVDADQFAAEMAPTVVQEPNDEPNYGVGELNVSPEVTDFPELDGTDAPEMTPTEYAICIQAVYEQHKPEKLADLAKLLQKYRNRERELYLEVCKKYTEHPAKFYARVQAQQQGLQ